MTEQNSTPESDWKDTIFLPVTEFPMRGDLPQREPATVERWKQTRLYERMQEQRERAPAFTLHDGPPYANGDIHHGHALNKILKDIVVKFRSLAGYRARYIPGWDCHGLPIEQKVDELLGGQKASMDVVSFRRECRQYAQKYIDLQRESFRRLMVLADYDHPYRTMDTSYTASIVRQVGKFMEGGYVYKGLKPVHWSWAAVTALAEAEVEYAPYVAPSVYVKFAFAAPGWLASKAGGRTVSVVIWTTTPWTLPSNVAIALHPDFAYELLAVSDSEAIIMAEGLKERALAACGLGDLPVLHSFAGAELVGHSPEDWPRLSARHPFLDRDSLLVAAEYVTLDQGTGCVHTAPGHGQEDFQTGLKYGLQVLAPVDRHGKYTVEVPEYQGVHVFGANPKIAQRLADSGHLLNQPGDTVRIERYPHCWRTSKPLIFRATEQWFIRVDHDDMRGRALQAISETRWVPTWGENRIRAMMEGRPDWCISRQRAWGVPIPAFRCTACAGDVVRHEVAQHVAGLIEQHGPDVWFERDAAGLVPEGFGCPHCGAAAQKFEKVEDILDVWFDSGASWAAVLRDREGLSPVADLYLEGSDQHRGWFHTSLLVGIGTMGQAPYKTVLTHGFVVDDKGLKYSKSSPRFEPLSKMLENNGAEVLRLWVSMVDFLGDMTLSPDLLKQAGGAYRKVRNTIRYILGVLSDYDPTVNPLDSASLTTLDRWALVRTAEFVASARTAYENYEFQTVQTGMFDFCNDTLSAIYVDALKDRLYCNDPDDASRRGSQAVLMQALEALLVVSAPILSFTADEAWAHLPKSCHRADEVFLSEWPTIAISDADRAAAAQMNRLLELRSRIAVEIEALRPRKKGERLPGQIGSSQEARVVLVCGADRAAAYQALASELCELTIVSDVVVQVGDVSHESGLDVRVELSDEKRCERCWNHRRSVGVSRAYPTLCSRCEDVVVRIYPSGPTATRTNQA